MLTQLTVACATGGWLPGGDDTVTWTTVGVGVTWPFASTARTCTVYDPFGTTGLV